MLCGARDEVYQCSLADVARWSREYQLVTGRYAFDRAENELAALWPPYREARARCCAWATSPRLPNTPLQQTNAPSAIVSASSSQCVRS